MGQYDHLSDAELKELVKQSEERLRKLLSPEEFEKFNAELEKQMYRVEIRDYVPPKSIRERLTEWVHFAPGYVLWLCKALKFILDVVGFLFKIGGGIAMLAAAWAVWNAWDSSGWRGLLDWPTLYIIGYFVILFGIDKLSFFLFRIIEGR